MAEGDSLKEGDTSRICSVYNDKGELVFNASEVVAQDGFAATLTVDTCALDASTLLQTAQSYLSEPDTSKTGIDAVAAECKRLGDFAPEGSKALLVADFVLKAAGESQKTGDFYHFARLEEGGLQIKDAHSQRPLVAMAPTGTVQKQQLNSTDRTVFIAMFEKLKHHVTLTQLSLKANAPKAVAKSGAGLGD